MLHSHRQARAPGARPGAPLAPKPRRSVACRVTVPRPREGPPRSSSSEPRPAHASRRRHRAPPAAPLEQIPVDEVAVPFVHEDDDVIPDVAPRPARVPTRERTASVSQAELDRSLASVLSQPVERSYRVHKCDIEGTIPQSLRGTLLRNGPANFAIGEHEYGWMDGDGLVASFTFDAGCVTYRRKFVRTQALREDTAAGQLLSKGMFDIGNPSGLVSSPFDFSLRQTANTGVLDWGSKLWALFEADLPYELDDSLRTKGKDTLGFLDETDMVAGHYRVVTQPDGSKRLVMMVNYQPGLDAINVFVEFDEAGRKISEEVVELKGGAFGLFHDFLVTENYYVFLSNPLTLDVFKLLFRYTVGKACLAECLKAVPGRHQKVYCIPRPGSAKTERLIFESSHKCTFHHVNAYELDGGNTVVIDTLARERLDFGEGYLERDVSAYQDETHKTTLRRIVCKAGARRATDWDLRAAPALNRLVEFPAMLPAATTGQPHSLIFCTTSRDVPNGEGGLLQNLAKVRIDPRNGVDGALDRAAVTLDQYYPGDRRYCREPVFVPREGATAEDDGFVLCIVQDYSHPDPAHTTEKLEIFDGRCLAAGPVAAIRLRDACAPQLHGSWTDRLIDGEADEVLPSFNDIRTSLSSGTDADCVGRAAAPP